MQDDSISLNKFISDTGYCSRREADELIRQGRVILNNELAQLGNRYTPGDIVEVDGSYLSNGKPKKEKKVYLAFNKPAGITCTTDTNIAGNIITYINYPKRIFPIGRLDKDSEGLIFLTNDGDIVNKILRASNEHEKEYIVRVNKSITPYFLEKMSKGVPILDTVTLPCKISKLGNHTFKIVLKQGLNRQIRRMCEYFEFEVESLKRVRIMNIALDKIALGKWRYLSDVEIAQIESLVKDSSKTALKPIKKAKPVEAKNAKKAKLDIPKEAFELPSKSKKPKQSSFKEYRKNKKR
ncbi:MAG: 23S rRNA pseudouridine(2604) synthase RluF [Chitinophagaceae bacterium]|nr:23S rRNA pseudouridine(2604) synthase RluF [Chitinophagaceae bacterium]